MSVRLDDICPPESRAGQALELLCEIDALAPQLYAWLVADAKTRGPRPPCNAEALGLLEQARRLYDD